MDMTAAMTAAAGITTIAFNAAGRDRFLVADGWGAPLFETVGAVCAADGTGGGCAKLVARCMTGRTISHYEILEKLGAGGMGEIYKARDQRLNRMVALKALPASAVGDSERRRRFIQEAQAASGLNHPNIITIHDILNDDQGNEFMVMELVAGRTLGEAIPRGGMGVAKTLQYAAQIADALAAAHAAGIVHRDLKPGNVMVTDAGRVKVLDFGLAKVTVATSLTDATRTIGSGQLTVEGSILGTVSYMSPEQAQGKRVDARSDIFSFGALVFEMVTGEKAFQGDSALTTLTAILRDPVRPMAELAGAVPAELEEVIRRALRKDPAERWQSMQDVHGVFAALRARYESGILSATQLLPPAPKKKRLPWAAAIAAIGLAAGIGGWYAATHRGRPAAPPQPVAQTQAPAPAPVQAVPVTPPKGEEKPSPLAAIPSPVTAPEPRRTSMPAPAVPGAPAVETKTLAVLSGLPVVITLMNDIPNDPAKGTPIRFQVKQDFTVNGSTAIRAGAVVTGEVAGVKKGILGFGGKATFRLFTVDAVDGSRIALRAAPGDPGEKAERVIEPSGRRDKSRLAPAGTEYIAYIDGAQSVTVRK